MKTTTPSLALTSVLALSLGLLAAPRSRASTAYGSINNFDVVNDTGQECHGFEIEIEDIHSRDITYTFDWNHYGTPSIAEDNSDPLHPKVIIRYFSPKNPDGSWATYTAIPSGPIPPTDGHQFTNPSVNFGGEHFGVGFRGVPGVIRYHWLVDSGGSLVRGPAVQVSTPTFAFIPAGNGAPAQVQAAIRPAPAAPVREFGPATWVKEIKTTTHNDREVKLRDLLSDDPDDPDDRNWRNGEPDEVEVEWQLLQTEFAKPDGGENGELKAAPEELPDGDEVVTRRYEFYKYTGPFDDESGEAKASKVAPDGIHGVGVKVINGEEIDLSQVEVVGEYIGSQMAAFDPEAPVGLVEHVQDGIVGEAYPIRTLVVAGAAPFTATLTGPLPPGMAFDAVTGELSGTPEEAGIFQFSLEARAGNDPVVTRNYTLTVAAPDEALPVRYTVDTLASPKGAGSTAGDGSYTGDTTATVTATPAPGFAFLHWSDNGRVVSQDSSFTFTNQINRSLVATFIPDLARLSVTRPDADSLVLSWSADATGFVLQKGTGLDPVGWTTVPDQPQRVGDRLEVRVTPLGDAVSLYRLFMP